MYLCVLSNRLRFDDLPSVEAGELLGTPAREVGGYPAILAFVSTLVRADRMEITYAMTFPAATIVTLFLVQIRLA